MPRLEPSNYKYNYVCQTCKQAYPRKRRMNIERYRCSRCGGRLMLED
ncbi:zinc ribbon domain-containing protein [Ligilactobacillus equi]|nr:zinc ribbon domain-containing protein [Ligilactobacillus equi]